MFCRARDLRVRRGGRDVLAVDAFDAPAGAVTAVVGPNGAGKTTLLHVLALLRRPDAGHVEILGRRARGLDPALRKQVVLVAHPGYLFHGSVRSNVLYGLRARRVPRGEAADRAVEALADVGLADFARRDAATLSAGERQRVNLARAIVLRPPGLLLDEPTANVDTATVAVIHRVLERLRDEHRVSVIHTTPAMNHLADLTDHVVHL